MHFRERSVRETPIEQLTQVAAFKVLAGHEKGQPASVEAPAKPVHQRNLLRQGAMLLLEEVQQARDLQNALLRQQKVHQ